MERDCVLIMPKKKPPLSETNPYLKDPKERRFWIRTTVVSSRPSRVFISQGNRLSASSTKPFLSATKFRNERQLRRRTTAHIIPPMKAVYTEEEAFAILFPNERSRQEYREELAAWTGISSTTFARQDQSDTWLAGPERNGSEDPGESGGDHPADYVPHGESVRTDPDSGYPKKNRLRAGRLHRRSH